MRLAFMCLKKMENAILLNFFEWFEQFAPGRNVEVGEVL